MTKAWRLYASSWPVFSGAVVVLFSSWVLLEVAVVATQRFGILPWAILHIGFLVLFAGLMTGFHRLALEAIDGRPPRMADLFATMDRGPTLLVGAIAYLAFVAIGIALLIVPGLYIAARLSLLGQVAAATRLSPLLSLQEAARVTHGHWWGAARTLAVVIVLNCLGAAILGIGLLVALPVSILTATNFYRSIRPATLSTASRS